jgi:cytochrome c oxidase accessory protein FixG
MTLTAATEPLPRTAAHAGPAQSVLSTLNPDGSRRWLKPRPSRGRFLTARRAVAWLLIALFTLLPHLKIGGDHVILLDIAARRFHLFGHTFFPTDTLLLALLMVGVFVTIFFVTALFGRVWCGWACPQTVYMEFVYRPLERLFEGTPGRLSKSWIARSGAGKLLKFVAFLLVSMFLAHTFLAYFVPTETLARWVRQSPINHPIPFFIMAVTTALMLFDFGYFREQTCIVACPYGRFQSALLDRSSLIITYDRARGEPRGKARRSSIPLPQSPSSPVPQSRRGDCVDCNLCVTTCPTGIDIRSGLQMECIGCAQCIDACDAVMMKLGRPRGLIRYSSQAAMAQPTAGLARRARLLRPRTVIYATLLTAIATAFLVILASRGPAAVTVLRGLGRPFTQLPSGEIANPVRIKVTNRSNHSREFTISSATGGVNLVADQTSFTLAPGESRMTSALLAAAPEAFATGKLDAAVRVAGPPDYTREVPFHLIGPAARTP